MQGAVCPEINIYAEELGNNDIVEIYEALPNTDLTENINTYNEAEANLISDNELIYPSTPVEDELVGNYYISTVDAEYAKNVQKALSYVDDDMSDFEKVLAIHDYIDSHCHYEYTDTAYTKYSARDVLVGGEAVCNGYSSVMKYLLDIFGIPCEMVTSDVMNHQWNEIQIDGNWYQLDATWDDPLYTSTAEFLPGGASKNYFIRSDSYYLSDTSSGKHYSYNAPYACNSTVYDGYFSGNRSSVYKMTDGKYIYNNMGSLYVTDNLADEGTCLVSGTQNINWYMLLYKDGLLYFNDRYNFYSYDYLTGEKKTLYSGTSRIGGAYETDSGFDIVEGCTLSTLASVTAEQGDDIPVENLSLVSSTAGVTCCSTDNFDDGIMNIGSSVLIGVICTPWNATGNGNVTWESSDTTVATVQNGLVTAKKAGNVTLTAKVGNESISKTFQIKDPNAVDIPLQTFTLNATKKDMKPGDVCQLSYEYAPTNTTDSTVVTWESSNANVATVSSQGLVTAVNSGTAVITATMGTKSSQCLITVTPLVKKLTSFTINPSAYVMEVGETYNLKTSYEPLDTTDSTVVTWESDSPSIASVDAHGTITALSPGTAMISGQMGELISTCKIYVNKVSVTKFTVDSSCTLNIGDTKQLTATFVPQNSATTVSWESLDTSIAAVSDKGLLTAIASGTTVIIAKANSLTAACSVTISELLGNKLPSFLLQPLPLG